MPQTGTWTREAIEGFLEAERPRYQRIELPFGLSTPGIDRRKTCEKIFAGDLAGKSVLDVGCCNGYFCLQALGRGARRAVGWDRSPDRVRHARAIAEMLGSTAEYQEVNIEETAPAGGGEIFDVVICLNVLHYVKDPIATLDKLIQLTGETLIIELASLGRRDRRNLGLSRLQSWFLARFPIMAVAGRHSDRKFFFTRSAIVNLLRFQRRHFAQVRIVDSGFRDRFIVVARRRRIGHLVIVAGPATAGKTALSNALSRGQAPELAAALGIENVAGWRTGDAGAIADIAEPDLEGLVLTYDFLLPYIRGTRSYRDDPVFQLMETARRVSLVTLWMPPERLARQVEGSEAGSALPDKLRRQLLDISRRPAEMLKFYDRWMRFCDEAAGKISRHLIVETPDSRRLYTREQWENTLRNKRGPGE